MVGSTKIPSSTRYVLAFLPASRRASSTAASRICDRGTEPVIAMMTGEPRHNGILTVGTIGKGDSDGSARRDREIRVSSEAACASRFRLRSYALPTRITAARTTMSAAATKSLANPPASVVSYIIDVSAIKFMTDTPGPLELHSSCRKRSGAGLRATISHSFPTRVSFSAGATTLPGKSRAFARIPQCARMRGKDIG